MSEQNGQEPTPGQFGRFEVTGVLGRGGMGVVYLARDPVIGREVAIKVLRPEPGLPPDERRGLQARFEQEFRSAGTLSHPNIVTVYDVGQDHDTSFIAMEYVAGDSLAGYLGAEKVLSFKEIADLAMQIGAGLDYAHERGIVHRDVKPANILITKEGRPKITDFGVAKVVSTSLTRTGTVIGTPAYMPPEQIVGQSVTGSADQFSMAIILYQLLTGELPFSGDNPTTILYKIVHEDPVGPHQLNPSLPEALDPCLTRALAKSPGERYPNCTALGQALSEALGAAPKVPEESIQRTVTLSQVQLGGGSGTYGGAMSWWQRQKPAPRVGMLAAGAVLAAGLGWWTMTELNKGEPTPGPEDPPIQVPGDTPPPAAAFAGTLRISAEGEGAAIWKDGKDTGLTVPGDLPLRGPVGTKVHLELRRGSEVVAQTEWVLEPDMETEWQASERRLVETYQVTSDPPGAQVLVAGQPTGLVTPAEIELETGKRYNVAVDLDGYERRSYAFSFPDGLRPDTRSNRNLFFRLNASVPPGYLVLDAPYELVVEVAGKREGPGRSHEIALPPGTYDIKLSAPSVFFSEERRGITVESDARRSLPVPPAVLVSIAAVPGNCRVDIDGRYVDQVPFEQLLSVGPHRFRFEWPSEGREKSVAKRISPATRRIFEALE